MTNHKRRIKRIGERAYAAGRFAEENKTPKFLGLADDAFNEAFRYMMEISGRIHCYEDRWREMSHGQKERHGINLRKLVHEEYSHYAEVSKLAGEIVLQRERYLAVPKDAEAGEGAA